MLFLGLGMLVGSDGPGGVDFSDVELTRTLGTIGLLLILFEGGLTAGWREIRPVLKTALSLGIVGTLLTALIAGLAAAWLFDLSTLEGLILGSAIAATDSAAIFAVLRGSSLRRRLARALEGESGMNDPVAVLLVTGFIAWIEVPGYGATDMILEFVGDLGIGALVGNPGRVRRALGLPPPRLPDRRPLSGRLDGRRGPQLRPRRGRARIGVPGRVPDRSGARHRDRPGAPHRHRLPPGAQLGRADLALLPAGAAGPAEPARRRGARGHGAGLRADLHRPPDRHPDRDSGRVLPAVGAADAELGGPARRGADLARDPAR